MSFDDFHSIICFFICFGIDFRWRFPSTLFPLWHHFGIKFYVCSQSFSFLWFWGWYVCRFVSKLVPISCQIMLPFWILFGTSVPQGVFWDDPLLTLALVWLPFRLHFVFVLPFRLHVGIGSLPFRHPFCKGSVEQSQPHPPHFWGRRHEAKPLNIRYIFRIDLTVIRWKI